MDAHTVCVCFFSAEEHGASLARLFHGSATFSSSQVSARHALVDLDAHGENKVFQGVRDLPKRCSHCLQLLKGLTVQVYFTLLIRVRTRPASIPMWRSGGRIHVAYRAGGGVCTV